MVDLSASIRLGSQRFLARSQAIFDAEADKFELYYLNNIAALPAAVLGATAPCVALNTYFGAPLMFFFFRGWLHGAAAADGPVARVLAAGLPGRARKAGVLAANFAVLLAVAFAK